MHHRHEERYKRAVARITPQRRLLTEARAIKELGFVARPKLLIAVEKVDALVAHKLGLRRIT